MSDLAKRALHTFWQAAVPVFIAGVLDVFRAFQTNKNAGNSAALALLIGAVAAGLSALKTAYVQNNK